MRSLILSTLVLTACGPALQTDDACEDCLTGALKESAHACSPGQAQPGACSNGEYCTISGFCAVVAAPTCGNFAAASSPIRPWNAGTSRGAVIFDLKAVTPDPTWGGSEPEVAAAMSVKLKAYLPEGQFPISGQAFPPGLLWYVRDDGFVEDAAGGASGGLFRRDLGYFTSADRRTVEITVNLMRLPNAGGAPGFIFEGGNPACGPVVTQQ